MGERLLLLLTTLADFAGHTSDKRYTSVVTPSLTPMASLSRAKRALRCASTIP